MARMIPSAAPPDIPDSERLLFREAERQLPANWIAIHGLHLSTHDSHASQEGEADFVVLDPERGALVLEVKGGGIRRTRGTWFSVDRDGNEHPIKNPGVQASAAAHRIHRFLSGHARFGRAGRRVEVRSGVVLPDVTAGQHLGIDLNRHLVIDHDDLPDLPRALGRVFDHHGMRGPRLTPPDVTTFLDALAPNCNLVPSLSSRFDREDAALVRLTEEQTEILRMLEAQERVAIQGAAGTGKTLLAVEKARRLAADGKRVLLLCFNRFLAEDLSTSVQHSGVVARHFHSYCAQQVQRAGLSWQPPRDGADTFWNEEAAELLLEALDRLPDERYDAIVVDEGQDFKPNWWLAIEEALHKKSSGTLYVFFDPHQNIYNGGPPAAIGVAPFSLSLNCRNTRHIAEYAAGLVDVEYRLRRSAPDGLAAERVPYRTPQEMADNVRKRLHRLTHDERIAPHRITVLSTHNPKRSALASHRRMGNLSLAPLGSALGRNQVPLASLHSFRGLESDVVLLVDVDSQSSPRHLYVAATRAKHLLVVMEQRRPESEMAGPQRAADAAHRTERRAP